MAPNNSMESTALKRCDCARLDRAIRLRTQHPLQRRARGGLNAPIVGLRKFD